MEIDSDLLEKYWAGHCSAAEQEAVEKWMDAGVPDTDYALSPQCDEQTTKHLLWSRIQDRNLERQHDRQPRHKPWAQRWRLTVGIAASLLVVLSSSLVLFYDWKDQTSLPADNYQVIRVPHGNKTKVTLPDGSSVHLNAGSTLKYPAAFERGRRHVLLEGEAFFSIAKRPNQPFTVETPRAKVLVLGTDFNVYSRDASTVRLTVTEGKVRFTATDVQDTVLLTANTQGVFHNGKIEKSIVDAANVTSWTTGKLVFKGVTLAQAVEEIERWFDVRIQLRDKELAEYRIKASFPNPSLTTVLHDLAFSMNIHYTIKDKEVTLYR